MKNIPKKIYLQVGDLNPEEVKDIDFNDLAEVSWCSDRIYKSDIEFVLSDVSASKQSRKCKECSREIETYKDACAPCRIADALLD